MLTFLAVVRSSSLTAAARERKVTPSQVSKAITRLESHFGKKLLERGSRGVVLSEAGRRIAPVLEEVVARLDQARGTEPDTTELTMGSPSYIQAALLPVIAQSAPHLRIRSFEMPPSLLRSSAHDEGFDVVLIPGDATKLPSTWSEDNVGELRKGLFGPPALLHRIGRLPATPETIADIPFVMPVYRRDGRIVPVDDDCPLPRTSRRVGHSVQTIAVGLEVAAQTGQLVYGPVVSAHRQVVAGALVEIPVLGWDVRESLWLACHVDRVSARLRTGILAALRSWMNAISG